MRMNKAVFLDRDGVLIEERGTYNYLPQHIVLNQSAGEALSRLKKAGYLLIVITNQSGIAKGIYGHKDVLNAHKLIQQQLEAFDVQLDDIYYCPHHPEVTQCLCRKPDSQML